MTIKLIFNKQKSIISELKKKIFYYKKKTHLFSLYDYFYFTNWSQNYGSSLINIKYNQSLNFFNKFKRILKTSYEFSSRELLIYNVLSRISKKRDYKNLIITYTNNREIKKKNFVNKIFNTSLTDLRKTLCLIINFDILNKDKIKLSQNIILINKKKIFLFFNPLFYILFIQYFFLVIIRKKDIYDKNFYNTIYNSLKNILKNFDIKNTFLAYESQPHQHYIIYILNKLKKNIKITGYLHSCLPSLPVDFIFKTNEPDLLLTNGQEQKNILINNLGWPIKKVKSIKSFRYNKKKKEKYLNKIFLPYEINGTDNLLNSFEKLILLNKEYCFKKFTLQNHPLMYNSKKHKNLLFSFKQIINRKNKSSHSLKNTSIVIGVSASILEILEHGIDVINVCENEVLESHNNKIWKSINVKKLTNNVFKYSIKKKGSIINFGRLNEFKKNYEL